MVSVIQRVSDRMLSWLVPKADASAGMCACNCDYSYYSSCRNCVRCYRCADCTSGGSCSRCTSWSGCC
jgi:hypothetical protein